MARPTKRQQFKKVFLEDIETNPAYDTMRNAIYKELILHLTTGEPRWLYDSVLSSALSYYDYIITVDKTLTPEEIITDLGDYVENELTKKMIEGYEHTTLLT